jgi:hypothetical protein
MIFLQELVENQWFKVGSLIGYLIVENHLFIYKSLEPIDILF